MSEDVRRSAEGHAHEGHAHRTRSYVLLVPRRRTTATRSLPLVPALHQRLLSSASIPKELRVLSVFDVFALLPFRSTRRRRWLSRLSQCTTYTTSAHACLQISSRSARWSNSYTLPSSSVLLDKSSNSHTLFLSRRGSRTSAYAYLDSQSCNLRPRCVTTAEHSFVLGNAVCEVSGDLPPHWQIKLYYPRRNLNVAWAKAPLSNQLSIAALARNIKCLTSAPTTTSLVPSVEARHGKERHYAHDL